MFRRLFLVLSLALLFGLGQQGAAVHIISHFADEQNQSQQDSKAHHASFCDKCVVYASLGSAVGADHLAFGPLVDHQAHFIESGVLRFADHTHHYAARAPPHPLV